MRHFEMDFINIYSTKKTSLCKTQLYKYKKCKQK